MARWTGEGNVLDHSLWHNISFRKEDAIHSLLASVRHTVAERRPGRQTNPRELPLLEHGMQKEGKKLTMEIKCDCKTIVDWVNGHAKWKTREVVWRLPRTFYRNGGAEESTYDNGMPIGPHMSFVSTFEEADLWAAKCVKGREDEWVDTAHVVWSEVTGLCGFWDGSCDNGKCGAKTMIQALTKTLGWVPIYKKGWPVTGQDSLDAERGGCGMLLENLHSWIDKSVR